METKVHQNPSNGPLGKLIRNSSTLNYVPYMNIRVSASKFILENKIIIR